MQLFSSEYLVVLSPIQKQEDSNTQNYNFMCFAWLWNLVPHIKGGTYEGVSKSFRTESIMKYTCTTINTRSEAT